jgi:hypothetical protein
MVLALALLAGLAVPVLADEAKGKIKNLTAAKKEFVFTDKDGKDWNCLLADDGKVSINNQDKNFSDLKEGDEVTITYEKQNEKLKVSKLEAKR